MDPDANYAEQQSLYGSSDPHDRARLRELVAALRGWVAAGGFKPKGFVGPAWKPTNAGPAIPVKRIGGAQAEQARKIGLVKIDRASAERLYDRGAAITTRAVNSFGAHLEPELGRHVAFFVGKDDYRAATGKKV